jgi:hypothetical protein
MATQSGYAGFARLAKGVPSMKDLTDEMSTVSRFQNLIGEYSSSASFPLSVWVSLRAGEILFSPKGVVLLLFSLS